MIQMICLAGSPIALLVDFFLRLFGLKTKPDMILFYFVSGIFGLLATVAISVGIILMWHEFFAVSTLVLLYVCLVLSGLIICKF